MSQPFKSHPYAKYTPEGVASLRGALDRMSADLHPVTNQARKMAVLIAMNDLIDQARNHGIDVAEVLAALAKETR